MKIIDCENQLEILFTHYMDIIKITEKMSSVINDDYKTNEYKLLCAINTLKPIKNLKIFDDIINSIDVSIIDNFIFKSVTENTLSDSIPDKYISDKYKSYISITNKIMDSKNIFDKLNIISNNFNIFTDIDQKLIYMIILSILEKIKVDLFNYAISIEVPTEPDYIIEDNIIWLAYENYKKENNERKD